MKYRIYLNYFMIDIIYITELGAIYKHFEACLTLLNV